MEYTREQRLEIARKVIGHEMTCWQACKECSISITTLSILIEIKITRR